MAAGAWVFTDAGRTNLLNGTFDIDDDIWKMALHTSSGTQPGAATTLWSGLSTSEVGTVNTGYVAGGETILLELSGTTTVKVDITTDPVWTAGTANLVAHWAVIYEVGGNVLCYCLLEETGPVSVTTTSGNTLTVAANAANGVFTLA